MKKQFDRFVLTSLQSQSGGGSVYVGEEKLPGDVTRPVLVKVLPALSRANPSAEKRFIEEVRVLAALAGQPHVITFYGMGITDGVPWIATEHAPADLSSLLGTAPAEPGMVTRMIEHVARGLLALHSLQPPMLHNRLHPGSVLVLAGDYFKVSDFGLAAPAGSELTLGVETIRYAAPELLSREFGPVGPAVDLYALGHMAYEMALGSKLHRQQFPAVWADASKPTDAGPARWQAWHHSIPTVVPPAHEVVRGFPARLGELIARLTAKPPSNRYSSASEVLTDLRGARVLRRHRRPHEHPKRQRPELFRHRLRALWGRAAPVPVSAPPLPDVAPAMATAAPPPSGDRFYVRLRDRITGPFDVAVLQRMARQGQLSRLHQLSADQQSWKPAASVEGLFG